MLSQEIRHWTPDTIFLVFTGWQLREAAENTALGDSEKFSIPEGTDFAAESAHASDFDQEEPTEELADLSAPLEQEIDGNSAAFEAADDPQEDTDSDSSPGQLLERVQRLLRWLKGCPHGAMARTGSQMQLPESEQLQVTGSSEQTPPTAETLPQQMSIVRPLRITMFLNGVLAGASLPEQAQQAPLMMQVACSAVCIPHQSMLASHLLVLGVLSPMYDAILLLSAAAFATQPTLPVAVGTVCLTCPDLCMQKDGLIRPQNSANLLQSIAAAQAAARSTIQDAPAHVSPQVLVSQGSMLPQSIAAFLQRLPQALFAGSMAAQQSAQLSQTQSLDPEWASIMPANALASIPGQNGATVVLTNARPQAQDMQGQASAALTLSFFIAATCMNNVACQPAVKLVRSCD